MTRWYVQRTDAGEVSIVARIRDEPDGLYPEVWNGATWKRWPPAMSYRFDPLAADEVDLAGAEAAIRDLPPRPRTRTWAIRCAVAFAAVVRWIRRS